MYPITGHINRNKAPEAQICLHIAMLLGFLSLSTSADADPPAYTTNFLDRAAVLSQWSPLEECSHCDHEPGRSQCTNFTLAATTFGPDGMTHTTRPLASNNGTACPHYKDRVCSSGHMTWKPNLLYGNFTVVARFFPGDASVVNTSTAFIGLVEKSLRDEGPAIQRRIA